MADLAAKEAATDPEQQQMANGDTKTLIDTAKKTVELAIYRDWNHIWAHGKHGQSLRSLGIMPDKKRLERHQHLPRAISSIITQMRTGKIGLDAYLHSINQAETSQCSCNQGEQTVEHILLRCREWTAEREEMWAGGRPILNLKGVIGDHKMAVRAARLMLRTGLLSQFQAVPTAPADVDSGHPKQQGHASQSVMTAEVLH